MRFMQDGTKIENFCFCENMNRIINKEYNPICEELFSKHDLEIQVIDSMYTDSAHCYAGKYLFCLVKSGYFPFAGYSLFFFFINML